MLGFNPTYAHSLHDLRNADTYFFRRRYIQRRFGLAPRCGEPIPENLYFSKLFRTLSFLRSRKKPAWLVRQAMTSRTQFRLLDSCSARSNVQ